MTADEREGAKEAPSKKIRMPRRPDDIPGSFWEKTRRAFLQGECDSPETLARTLMREKEELGDELIKGWRRVGKDLEVKCGCRRWVKSRFAKCPHCGKQLHKPHSTTEKEPPAEEEPEGISCLPKPPN